LESESKTHMIFMGNSCGPTLIVTDPPVGWSKIRENVILSSIKEEEKMC
jgi:hypothetical protein